MQDFDDFLEENYEITIEQFYKLPSFEKNEIQEEYNAHIKFFIGGMKNV